MVGNCYVKNLNLYDLLYKSYRSSQVFLLKIFSPNKSTVKNFKRANYGRFVFLCFKLPPCYLGGGENWILSPRLQHTRLLLPHLKAPGLVSGYSALNVVHYFRCNGLALTAKSKSFNAFLTEIIWKELKLLRLLSRQWDSNSHHRFLRTGNFTI